MAEPSAFAGRSSDVFSDTRVHWRFGFAGSGDCFGHVFGHSTSNFGHVDVVHGVWKMLAAYGGKSCDSASH